MLAAMMFGLTASQALAFSIQPAIIDLRIDPGTREQRSIHLTNEESSDEAYTVTVQKFIPSGTNGQQEFLPPDDTNGLPDWTFVDAPSVTLKPGASTDFPISFRVPSDAAAGTYTEAIFFSLVANQGQGNVATTPRIGALVFLTVKGALIQKQSLDSFVSEQGTYQNLPVGFVAKISNNGNVVTTPSGSIQIKNFMGVTVKALPINDAGGRILPGSTRTLPVVWSDDWAFGPYTATVHVDGAMPAEASLRFYVWPMKWILGGIIGFVVLVVGYFLLKRVIIYRATR